MYRNTRFGELLKGLPRGSFEKIVDKHNGDKYSKGFQCWDQLLAMVYAQISGSKSLREIETGFNSQESSHYHLGAQKIKRSTLSDANNKRNVAVYAETCSHLMHQVHRGLRKEMTDLLYLLDSTPIPLKGLGYEWAQENHNSRTHGLKVHVLLASESVVPVNAEITAANVNDIDKGREMTIEEGATYVFDKGYCDYNWWYELHQQGAYFVTRLKKNAGMNSVEKSALTDQEIEAGILEDAIVEFKNRRPGGHRINHYHGTAVRRVVVDRPDKDSALVLVTNDFSRTAIEIAALYKQRWGIELFFKWLKQNLKIKRFVGCSENAVRIQIYTALITYLLIHMNHALTGLNQNLKLWVVELRESLFHRPETQQITNRKRRQSASEFQKIQGALAL